MHPEDIPGDNRFHTDKEVKNCLISWKSRVHGGGYQKLLG